MLSVDEARARMLEGLSPTPPEIVALPDAWGRVSAAPVVARLTQPPENVSAMDGYALRAVDASRGARLALIGSAPAGHPFAGQVGPGRAVRIFTGGVVPVGADTILVQEDARAEGEVVAVEEAAQPSRHIRRRGQDFVEGEVVIPAGRRLSARDIGVVAAANHPWVAVHRAPRVAILATGDEIALPGDPILAGGIVSSNSHALAALVRACGGIPIVLPIATDDRASLAQAADQARGVDLLVTTGGVSVGAHDLVREVLGGEGMALDFWQIAMRPGKPVMHGRLGGVPVIGLPGNPVSTLVCGAVFLLPVLRRLSGLPGDPPPTEPARLGVAIEANDKRFEYMRARLARDVRGLVATPFSSQDSAMTRVLAEADALILRPSFSPAMAVGDEVQVIRFSAIGL